MANTRAAESGAPIPRFVGPGYCVAFVAVSLAGFAQAATAPSTLLTPSRLIGLALASTLYALLGTLGMYLIERRGSRPQLRSAIVLMLLLAAATTWLSHGYTSMMLLAVVSAGVLHLSAAGSVGLSVLAAALALLGFAQRSSLLSALVQAEIAFGSGIAFVFVFSRIALREQRTRMELEQTASALASANAQLSAQAGAVEELATTRERNRIARDIHDGLGHYLTVVHIQLQAADTYLESDPERARIGLARAQQLTHEGLSEVRRSVSLLRGSAPAPQPLIDALSALAAQSTTAGLATAFAQEGTPRTLPEPLEFTLYRAAQEGLTNARRHARATGARLSLCFDASRVRLRLVDDGVGSDDVHAGFGIVGLRERAELVSGELRITTARDRGFVLELEVPG